MSVKVPDTVFEGPKNLLAVYSPLPSRLEVKHAGSDIRILSLAHFTFTVEIPNRLRQRLENVRSLRFQNIIHLVRRGNV